MKRLAIIQSRLCNFARAAALDRGGTTHVRARQHSRVNFIRIRGASLHLSGADIVDLNSCALANQTGGYCGYDDTSFNNPSYLGSRRRGFLWPGALVLGERSISTVRLPHVATPSQRAAATKGHFRSASAVSCAPPLGGFRRFRALPER